MSVGNFRAEGARAVARVLRAMKWPLSLAGLFFLVLLLAVAPTMTMVFMLPVGVANGLAIRLLLAVSGRRRCFAALLAGGCYLFFGFALPYAAGSGFGIELWRADAWWALAWFPGAALALLAGGSGSGRLRAWAKAAPIVAFLLGVFVPTYLIVTGVLRIDL